MTNEESVPSTSSVLSAAEKNVKITSTPASKKRKGLDIDALWKMKEKKMMKEVENHQSPEKTSEVSMSPVSSSSESGANAKPLTPSGVTSAESKLSEPVHSEESSSEDVTSVSKKTSESKEELKSTVKSTTKKDLITESGKEKVKDTVADEKRIKIMKGAPVEQQKGTTPKESTPPVSRSTRSSRKKTEEEKKKMEMEDVKPNIKLLKKVPQDSMILRHMSNMTLNQAAMANFFNERGCHEEEEEEEEDDIASEMEVMQRNGNGAGPAVDGERGDGQYGYQPYNDAVTPNGQSYTLYGPDATYTPYYSGIQYNNNNMQASPHEDNGQYLVPAPQSPVSIEDQDTTLLPNNQRASPATVTWLFENYEIAEGSSLPRCQLYDHYRAHCAEHRMDPVNAASFGKLIRSVFQNLKTRRLGTRGNSKYHYYGIKMKDSSCLHMQSNTLQAEQFAPPLQHIDRPDLYTETVNSVATQKSREMYVPVPPPRKTRKRDHSSTSSSDRDSPIHHQPQQLMHHQNSVEALLPPSEELGLNMLNSNYIFTDADRQGMGTANMPNIQFKDKDILLSTISFRKLGLGEVHLNQLIEHYDLMSYEILSAVKSFDFGSVEELWNKFWTGNFGIKHDVLMALCTLDKVQDYIIEVDLGLYQTIVDCMIPNVLLSELSPGMTQSCRTFAKNIDVNLRKTLVTAKVSEQFLKKKIQTVKYMQQGLKRYTSLNHLAHAARGVLLKEDQCNQMFQDYIKVDIQQVHQQAGWICGCDSVLVNQVNEAFKANLLKQSPMSVWSEWLESIVDQVLARYHDKPAATITNVGKQFLLNWSFYTSMIIRELTLRSATSFGSFTLIRLLADDYMYHLIAVKIAKASNQPLIAVIRQEKDWPLAKEVKEYIVPSQENSDNQ